LVQESALKKRDPIPPGYCSLEKKVDFQLVSTDGNAQEVYSNVFAQNQSLDFLDHFALWNLMQLSSRPDQSSATSRFQVLLHQGTKSYYFDFFSEDTQDQYPLLYGLEWILKKFGKKKTIEQYARMLNSSVGQKLKIGKDLEAFLIKNITLIKSDPALSALYFRGSDVLKENETAPLLNYSEVIKIYRKAQAKQKIIVNTTLTSFVTERGYTGSCNYDFNLYENSIFLIDKIIPVANLYGLSTKTSAFFASNSQRMDKISSLEGLPIFKGFSKVRSSAVCMIENQNNKIWTFSNQSRDPGQHLFHLVRYGLPTSQTTAEVDKLIRHSRHLFLSDPVRLIIESGRSSAEQIQNLLKLNIPIYNADKLGNIWAYTMFKEGNRFITDDRNQGAHRCQ
jgi:hypothetical protein